MRPLWRNVAGSLATVVNIPAGSVLWYDDRDIAFLQEDGGMTNTVGGFTVGKQYFVQYDENSRLGDSPTDPALAVTIGQRARARVEGSRRGPGEDEIERLELGFQPREQGSRNSHGSASSPEPVRSRAGPR